MNYRRFIRMLSLCMLFVGVCVISVVADSDTEAPYVTSYKTDKAKYSYGDTINITLDIEETGSGVSEIDISMGRFVNPTQGWVVYTFCKTFDPTKYSGTYTFSFKDASNTAKPLPEGNYKLDQIEIIDGAGNRRQYDTANYYVDESGNQLINGTDICYVPNGITFSVGDVAIDSVKVESLQIDTEDVDLRGNVALTLRLSQGQNNQLYDLKLDIDKGGTLFELQKVSFCYAEKVTVSVPLPSSIGFGKYGISSLSIKPSSFREYKVYTNSISVLEYSESDKCQFAGNNYIYINPPSADDRRPEVTAITFSPAYITKPGYLSGKLSFNVPTSKISQFDVSVFGKGTSTFKGTYVTGKAKDSGSFSIALGNSVPANDYYIDQIVIYDIYGGVWRYNGCSYYTDGGYYTLNLDEQGRQYFLGQDENDDQIEIFPEFTGAKYVTVADEFEVAFHSSLKDPSLLSKITALKDGETGRIDLNSDFVAKADVFRAIAGRNVRLLFVFDNYQWVFNGKDIKHPKDVILTVKFEKNAGEDYDLSIPLLKVIFPDNGTLPGKANIRIKSDYTLKLFDLTGNIYLYYEKKDGNLISESQSNPRYVLDDTDHWCYFDLTHNSSFILSGKTLGKNVSGPAQKKGSDFKSVEKAIKNMKLDGDIKGSVFFKLKLTSLKQTNKSITLRWNKTGKAAKYVIYGNKCGKTNKPKKVATIEGKNTKVLKSIAGKKLKKGTYYKFIIVALDKKNNVVSTSKLIHVATKGNEMSNYKRVTVRKNVISKAKKLKKGNTLKINAKAVAQSKQLKVKKHVDIRYESTNKKIATVSKSGIIKARRKGICYVYAYAQNGVFTRIKVTVQ